jgi:hypothetical protein
MPKSGKTPRLTPENEHAAAVRQERLAAALRANLARRKAQSRERAAAAAEEKSLDPRKA